MYKMTLKYRELELSIESPTPIVESVEDYENLMKNAVHLYHDDAKTPEYDKEIIENTTTMNYNSHAHIEHDAMTVIRDRLPNRSNTVNLSELEVKAASGTAHSHFRCPSCAQSAVMIANGNPIVRDIINDDACFSVDFDTSGDKPLTYEEACKNTIEQVRFVVGDGMTSQCAKCKAVHPTEEFVKAYHHPLDYFETDDPCPLCGESLWLENKQGKTYLKCEEPCVFEKEVQKD